MNPTYDTADALVSERYPFTIVLREHAGYYRFSAIACISNTVDANVPNINNNENFSGEKISAAIYRYFASIGREFPRLLGFISK